MKKLIFVLVPGLLLLGACGDDTPDTPENKVRSANEKFNSSLVEADGVVYRCFDTGNPQGGIWCTVKPKGTFGQ